ncbi:MAG: ABC transporter permease [Treponema sp.]|jgi:peptide/nickel transport system permease protein|nr:ABC transporter permease [Treponema sp.]
MLGYIIRRLAAALLVSLGVCFLTFSAIHFSPGEIAETVTRSGFVFDQDPPADAVEATALRYGLNNPFWVRFAGWLLPLLRGDFGVSYSYNIPVMTVLLPKLANTLELGFAALLAAILIGILTGAIAGIHQGGIFDRANGILSLALVSSPSFCLGLGLIILFSIYLRILPVSGKETPVSIVLPALTQTLGMAPVIFQMTRGSVIDLKNQEFIKMAKAKGLPPGMMITRHYLKNTAIPLITVIASQAGHMLGGSVVVESVFGWPGVGKLLIDSIKSKDVPVLQCCVLVIALGYSLVNFLADLGYGAADPRIRAGKT